LARTDHFTGIPRYCLMCQTEIPADRKADAITCSKDCTIKRQQYLRSKRDSTECRYCFRPSTPEERARFNMWRKWEKKNAGDEQFAAQVLETTRLVRENTKLKQRLAELEEKTNA
jgi:hypothetical protein